MKKIAIVAFGLIMFWEVASQCLPIADNMTLLDSWDISSDYSDVWGYVAPDGKEYAITADRTRISIIDVSDPTDIEEVVNINQGDNSIWRDFKIYGHYLYSIVDQNLSINDNGIVIYDLSNLPISVSKVREVNSEFEKGHNIYVEVENERLYACGMRGQVDVCVYDLSLDAGNPTLWKCIDLDTVGNPMSTSDIYYLHDIFVKDNILYGSHGNTGYHIWDLNDRDDIKALGSLDGNSFDFGYVHSSWNSDDDNHAVVATELGTSPQIYWLDQSDLNNIRVLYKYKEPLCDVNGQLANKRPHNPYIIGDKIYTSFYHDGLHVLEIDFEADILKRVGYYDTYPDNTDYNVGFQGAWGAYPYLPSGTILASDISNGLFTLRYDGPPTYTFLGPGTDWDSPSNWYNGAIPPSGFIGSVVISSDCIKDNEDVILSSSKIIVNTGATFTQN